MTKAPAVDCWFCMTKVQNTSGPGASKKYCEGCAPKAADVQMKVGAAKQRAAKNKLAFNLDSDDVLKLGQAQGWKCAVTGIAFVFTAKGGSTSPWAPSLDRKSPALGYTAANTQLVVWSYNVVKADWNANEVPAIVKALHEGLSR